MSARALWRGVVRFGAAAVPVRLYAAVEDRRVSFRLLHREDGVPVRGALVNPLTDEVVAYREAGRGYVTPDGAIVALEAAELEALEPEPSRDVAVTRFVPAGAIEHRWYRRPYFLGPDGDDEAHAALAAMLARTGREGVAHWVMRDRVHHGSLRLHRGYPMLVTLRSAAQVAPLGRFEPGEAGDLDERQLALARQLIEALSADLDPDAYRDEHREAVLDLVAAKREGREVAAPRPRERPATTDLTASLERSLARAGGAGGRA